MSKVSSRNSNSKPSEYQKLEEIDHILKRPDMYMGENKIKTKQMFVYDIDTDTVSQQSVTFSTGLLKICDEVAMNAIDNLQRRPVLKNIDVTITDSTITIRNDGKSIPIELFDGTNVYIPEVLFTQPRSGSNFNDKEERTVGGRNGIGCKITSIFSSRFIINIVDKNKHYEQIITNNVKNISPPTISKVKSPNYVSISFSPDLSRFQLSSITDDMKKLIYKRFHDLSYLPVTITVNNITLPRLSWDDFVASYGYNNLTTYVTSKGYKWYVSFGIADKPCEVSFVNNIRTYNGGEHVKYIREQIANQIIKQAGKNSGITTQMIKAKLVLFVSATIVNPAFDSQAKEKLTTQPKDFGENNTCNIPVKTIKAFIDENNVVDIMMNKMMSTMNNKMKRSRVKNIEKLVEANKAGGAEGYKCTLFICEGLSAKTMVDSGICILGHDYYGCYPLRGKVLNARNASAKQYHENRELTDLKSIIGLEDGKEYESIEGLRYGKVVCVKDADSDGADIMGLVINFFHTKFPSLLQIDGFFAEFISPMIQVIVKNTDGLNGVENLLPRTPMQPALRKRGKRNKADTPVQSKNVKIPFYNEVEYARFMDANKEHPSIKSSTVKFIKGLATNEDDDITTYFNNYNDNCINIEFPDGVDDYIDKSFNGKRTEDRKDWLTTITPDTHLPRVRGEPISCIDFVENDLALYAMDACVRSIPSLVDGLKPSQRKILYTLFGLPDTQSHKIMKVFQLGGLVAKTSNYHHGDQSMNATIIKMAQDFPGSNNIPLLERSGQFGSRQENGDDAGQPRYIGCCLADIARLIFPKIDDVLLEYQEEDNQKVEPKYYIPIIPMVLVNGCRGMGMGWSTLIPSFSPSDIIEFVKHKLECEDENHIRSWYKGFIGDIVETQNGWEYYGKFERDAKDSKKVHVTEIPIDISIADFEQLLKDLRDKDKTMKINIGGKNQTVSGIVKNFKNNNTKNANSVNYQVEFFNEYSDDDLIKILKLVSKKGNGNMVLFNKNCQIQRYGELEAIIDEWFSVRYMLYMKRIQYMIDCLERDKMVASNKARFIKENIDETINIKNVKIDDVVKLLEKSGYDKVDDKFDYLVDMKMRYLTKEKYEELLNKVDELNQEIDRLQNTTVEEEWLADLAKLEAKL